MEKCISCGSNEQRFIFEVKGRLHDVEVPSTFKYVQCKQCSLVFMQPQISSEELKEFYTTDYAPHQVIKPDKNKEVTSKSGLYRRIKAYFYDQKNVTYVPYFIKNALNTKSKVLDVGCGNGTFLNDLREETGCQAFGVDISDLAVTAAKESYNLEITKGSINGLTFPERSFDLITAWWSLAHVHNPVEELQSFSKLLKDDGYCILGMPNFNSFNATFFKTRWFHLDPPRHLYIFSHRAITHMLKNNGFSVKQILHGRQSSGLICSMLYVYHGSFAAPHKFHPFLSKLLFIAVTLIAWLRYSDLIVVIAQKDSLPP